MYVFSTPFFVQNRSLKIKTLIISVLQVLAQALTIDWQVNKNNKEVKLKNNTTMKSSKVNTKYSNSPKVKNLSAIIAIMLAAVTLFQAGAVKSDNLERKMTKLEAELIAETEQFFAEEEELSIEDMIYLEMEEEQVEEVSIFDNEDNLLASGDPSTDDEVRQLLNQADYLSEFGGKKYYRLSK